MNKQEKLQLNYLLNQLDTIDYLPIVELLNIIVSYHNSSKNIPNYKLYKDFKLFKQVNLPPKLVQKYTTINKKKIFSLTFKKEIMEFSKTIIEHFDEKNLINFYNNINELKIKNKSFHLKNIIFNTGTVAAYKTKQNLIEIEDNNYLCSIYHELFHMASSIFINNIYYSGFRQTSFKIGNQNLGSGLNEGYTQLLTERYFKYIKGVSGFYYYNVQIADKIEKIVGQTKMENLYMNANLPGLINELKKYIEENEIIKFIHDFDFLHDVIYHPNQLILEKFTIKKKLTNICEFLLKTYSIKLCQELLSGSINEGEFKTKLTNFVSSLVINFKLNNYNYNFLTNDVMKNCLNKILTSEAKTKMKYVKYN